MTNWEKNSARSLSAPTVAARGDSIRRTATSSGASPWAYAPGAGGTRIAQKGHELQVRVGLHLTVQIDASRESCSACSNELMRLAGSSARPCLSSTSAR